MSRWGWVLVAANVLATLLIVVTQDLDLILPNLVAGNTNSFSLAYVLAFLPGLSWIVVRSNRPSFSESTSVRRVHLALLDILLALVPTYAAFLVLTYSDNPVVNGAARNMLLVVAMSVVASETLSRQFSFLVPVGYLLAAGTAGFAFRAPRPADWALILDEWVPVRDWITLAVFVAAACLVLITARLNWAGRRGDAD